MFVAAEEQNSDNALGSRSPRIRTLQELQTVEAPTKNGEAAARLRGRPPRAGVAASLETGAMRLGAVAPAYAGRITSSWIRLLSSVHTPSLQFSI